MSMALTVVFFYQSFGQCSKFTNCADVNPFTAFGHSMHIMSINMSLSWCGICFKWSEDAPQILRKRYFSSLYIVIDIAVVSNCVALPCWKAAGIFYCHRGVYSDDLEHACLDTNKERVDRYWTIMTINLGKNCTISVLTQCPCYELQIIWIHWTLLYVFRGEDPSTTPKGP